MAAPMADPSLALSPDELHLLETVQPYLRLRRQPNGSATIVVPWSGVMELLTNSPPGAYDKRAGAPVHAPEACLWCGSSAVSGDCLCFLMRNASNGHALQVYIEEGVQGVHIEGVDSARAQQLPPLLEMPMLPSQITRKFPSTTPRTQTMIHTMFLVSHRDNTRSPEGRRLPRLSEDLWRLIISHAVVEKYEDPALDPDCTVGFHRETIHTLLTNSVRAGDRAVVLPPRPCGYTFVNHAAQAAAAELHQWKRDRQSADDAGFALAQMEFGRTTPLRASMCRHDWESDRRLAGYAGREAALEAFDRDHPNPWGLAWVAAMDAAAAGTGW